MSLYHTPAWKYLRAAVLKRQPLCALCLRKKSSHVDHIRPHRGNLDLFLDANNLQALCWSCHSAKTLQRDGGFGKKPSGRPLRGSDDAGLPTDPLHPWNAPTGR